MNEIVTIIGAGRLAWSLIPNLQGAGYKVEQIISPNLAHARAYALEYNIPVWSQDVSDCLPTCDWIVLCVPDQHIATTALELKGHAGICLHCSGSTGIEALDGYGARVGVLWPLQLFTQSKIQDLQKIPLFIEAKDAVVKELSVLARRLSRDIHLADSNSRLRLHLGAVWASNFSNQLFKIAASLQTNGDFQVFRPLLEAHLEKVFAVGPEQSQTGPAIRGDKVTIAKHLDVLADKPEWQALYRSLSLLINPALDI